MKSIFLLFTVILLQGCATTLAALDVAGSTAIYSGRTVVRTLDLVTPDVVK